MTEENLLTRMRKGVADESILVAFGETASRQNVTFWWKGRPLFALNSAMDRLVCIGVQLHGRDP